MGKDLLYREFIQRENDLLRAPYNPELEFYSVIKSGDVEKTRELCAQSLLTKPGLGTLSTNDIRNIKYHFVITTALVARYCIEGGLELSAAYGLSDFYIQRADTCKTAEEVANLHPIMCVDYAKRMRSLRKRKICSKHIAYCLDYIFDHLHKRITVEDLADHVNLQPAYLSRLFKKEVGCPISTYIRGKKIETAENMLIYSDYSPAQISATLAFPSQSYFTQQFRQVTGMTPAKYRQLNLRNTGVHEHSL